MKRYSSIVFFSLYDLLKSKALYVSLCLGLLTFITTWVTTVMSFGNPAKIAADIGLGVIDLSSLIFAVAMGAMVLTEEVEQKKLYLILSRPIDPFWFYIAKSVSIISVIFLNVLVISLGLIFAFFMLNLAVKGVIILAIVFYLMKSIMLFLVTQALGFILSKTLSVFVSLSLYVVGMVIGDEVMWKFVQGEAITFLLKVYDYLLPAYYRFNIKDIYLYDGDVTRGYVLGVIGYGGCYIAFLLLLGGHIFKRRELN